MVVCKSKTSRNDLWIEHVFKATEEPIEAMISTSKETILFVDDEESILEIALEYFQEKGYRVLTAKNGLEAARIILKDKIDCCFTDINMPEMDGLELAEYIWRNDNTIPVIIVTGFPSLDNAISTLKHGVVDFLVKPVNLSQMELCLKRVLRERSLFVENILLRKEIEGKERLEKLNAELIKKVEELNVLNRIMTEFTSIESSTDAFRSIVDMAIELTGADEAGFWVINESVNRPFEVAAAAKSGAGLKTCAHPSIYILETAAQKAPLLVSSKNDRKNGLSSDTASFMAIPLNIREKIFGVLTAATLNGAEPLDEKDLYYLSFMTNKAAYAIENLALYENIYENLFSTLYALVRAIEAKDPPTRLHSTRVAAISVSIGKELGCSTEELDILNFAGHLHDIGKIGVRDEVLQKSDRLTEEEFGIIKEHSTIGAGIVGQLGLWDREREIIKHHHESWDGTGYPDGLKGREIPLLVRILTIADVFDAMTSDRIYRKKMDGDHVFQIIKSQSGSKFDPRIVTIFEKLYFTGEIQSVLSRALEQS